MKILFLSTKGPLPTNDGHALRTYNLLKQIALIHQVYLLSFVKFQEEYCYINEIRGVCRSVNYAELEENASKISMGYSLLRSLVNQQPFVALKYYKKNMQRLIQDIVDKEHLDLVHIDILPMSVYLELFQGIPTVLNAHNVESLLLDRQVLNEKNWLKKIYLTSQQKKLSLFERMAAKQVDHIITCSEEDRKIFESFAPRTSTTIVPNGVDVEFFCAKNEVLEQDMKIVFVGGLNWFPNLDGLKWFDEEVLPYVLRKCPNICIYVIGRYEKDIKWKHNKQFCIKGFVPDIRPYLEVGAVVIVPLRIGGGTRLKILDAMSMSKAIVSTSIGAEGLGVSDGINIVLRDNAEDFAEGIIELIEDREKRQSIKKAARFFVEENYQWKSIGSRLLDVYEKSITGVANTRIKLKGN